MRPLIVILTIIIYSLIVLKPTFAQLGVGVGLGRINIDQVLAPGGVYKLPDLPVVNTGEIDASYKLSVSLPSEFLQKFLPDERKRQELLLKNWISFNPSEIYLKPKESKNISVSLLLPLTAPKGEYFLYLEAQTKEVNSSSNVSLGPAAATKLYFEVGNAPGVLGAFKQRVSTLWNFYQPWSTILTVGLDLLLVLFLARTLFSFRFELRHKSNGQQPK